MRSRRRTFLSRVARRRPGTDYKPRHPQAGLIQELHVQLIRTAGEWCTFQVASDTAQQVKLVIDFGNGASENFALEKVGKGLWETAVRLAPGVYRFCYHLYDGRMLTYLTPPGLQTDGLKAVLRVAAHDEPPIHNFGSAAPSRMPLDLHEQRSLRLRNLSAGR